MSTILKLDGLTKAFGAVTVADGLSYELSQGEALGVIGPNGAGKTNLLEGLSFLVPGRGLRRARLADVARYDGGAPAEARAARRGRKPRRSLRQPCGGGGAAPAGAVHVACRFRVHFHFMSC